ncbi:unnamed protein product [Oppiella nova]|uniref:DEP domain-containing protein n=1 Tax=Oppiella nova TaxID=334625 RepID=A0A7R9LER5_9ACAR|nr:unnamed protein product [Oppiella nova]CAG2162927.1 unnamed protein product [Oppiella nova]
MMSCLMLSFLKWNQVLHSFYIGITPKKHRKHMRTHYNCFVATDAVDWILNYLQFSPHFTGQQISRFQAINLLRKYLETDVIERVDARKAGQQFQDNKELYRFTNTLEQFLFNAVNQLILSTYLSESNLRLIPLLNLYFLIGRITYWIGYQIAPKYRTFGFTVTFWPSVAVFTLNAYFLLTTNNNYLFDGGKPFGRI